MDKDAKIKELEDENNNLKTQLNKCLLKNKTHYEKNMETHKQRVVCCKCMLWCLARDALMPRRCLTNNGFSAHRVCIECWFREDGFANDNRDRACCGCVSMFPLTVISGFESEDNAFE